MMERQERQHRTAIQAEITFSARLSDKKIKCWKNFILAFGEKARRILERISNYHIVAHFAVSPYWRFGDLSDGIKS